MGTANGHQGILPAAPGQHRTAAVPSPHNLSRTRNTHPPLPLPTAEPPERQRTSQTSPPRLHREPVPTTAILAMMDTRRAETTLPHREGHLPVPPAVAVIGPSPKRVAAAEGAASLEAPTPPRTTPLTRTFSASSRLPLALLLPLPLTPFPWRKSTRRAPGSRTENRGFLREEGAASRGGGTMATATTAMVVAKVGANHQRVRGCSSWAIASRGELRATTTDGF